MIERTKIEQESERQKMAIGAAFKCLKLWVKGSMKSKRISTGEMSETIEIK